MSSRSLFLVGHDCVNTIHGVLLLSNSVMLQDDLIKIVPAGDNLFLISTVACINKKLFPQRSLKTCKAYLISQLDPLSEDSIFIFLKQNQVQDKISFQSIAFDQ